ncbi:hypothetical protein [Thermus scotoductus]|uniref:hypothetical protein n=1 Tax=Thermus scotoductus TaxID=37636 RepID=UPI000361F655|nr:hypothetical protein [Thermus scotoductus]
MRKRKWHEDLPALRREVVEVVEVAREEPLVKRGPLRVIPVEVVEVKRKGQEGSRILNFIKFWGTIFWAIAGFWLAMALVARLLGF